MGLPLYTAPVESDIHPRPAPKSPVHSRSAIRRVHRRQESSEWAEARQRALAQELGRLTRESAAAANDDPSLLTSHPPPTAPPADAFDFWEYPPTSRRHNAANQDSTGRRRGGLDERALTVMGERWASLYTRANPESSIDREEQLRVPSREGTGGWARRTGRVPSDAPLNAHARPSRLFSRAARRYPAATDYRDFIGGRAHRPPPPPPPAPGSRERSRISSTPPFVPSVTTAAAAAQSARLDGLGDRNRSLSPEGDGVWDTLLTTITPDPQPPSAESSFASSSASVSAATSQSLATGSSSTSLTSRDPAVDESISEPNCESACENSETEGDEDEDEEGDEDGDDAVRHALARFPSSLRRGSHRSYADVAGRTGSNSSGGEDPLEFLGDMQRIVRHFARREDIPDEWWAEVGLSRTLSRASN